MCALYHQAVSPQAIEPHPELFGMIDASPATKLGFPAV
jgi:hypothetical protein